MAAITTHPNDVKERLSAAYVTAVAGAAGCQVSKLEIDKQSIDATLRPISGQPVSVDLQVKATSADCISNGVLTFALPIKNYDDLRQTVRTAPIYLVVLVLGNQNPPWVYTNQSSLLVRRCAYWFDLSGQPESSNSTSVTVHIPTTQIFSASAVVKMMDDAYAKCKND
ncbi:DUF4365 domain-containing protein [Luteibacter yeojuensis]|uniref:DUF4365 domain-containing protein n=1 Tax=Luteibacter yeojuensis TaxID=345309 RepID=A0A0F3KBW3_9GAMM|nr:DUF4365 domain-containing protein [Luteibacter yeojuensis]KJV28755.1 hypothetical protein VI08_16625 [Luteibacter yeojuensis]